MEEAFEDVGETVPLWGEDISENAVRKTGLSLAQFKLRRLVDHIGVRLFSVMLVLVDISLLIVRIARHGWSLDRGSEPQAYLYVSNAIIAYFCVEIALRILARPRTFFFNKWDVLDFVVVLVSTVLSFVFAAGRAVIFVRLVRIFLFCRLVATVDHLPRSLRLLVSQNKRRYREDGFDLDLTYITDRVIAQSFPSTGKTALYRNPINEVARFFKTKHAGHYMLFNACSEREFDAALFENRVQRLYVDDHNVPLLSELMDFCVKVKVFMKQDARNVVAINCKGGKGRTGTLVCAWLLYCGRFEEATDALQYFGKRRTDLDVGNDFQGVETPSQARYVHYVERVILEHNATMPAAVSRTLSTVRVIGLASCPTLTFQIFQAKELIYDYRHQHALGNAVMQLDFPGAAAHEAMGRGSAVMEFDVGTLAMRGDIKIVFQGEGLPRYYEDCPFYFWFHTTFVDGSRLVIRRDEMDNPHKKKTWKIYPPHFAVELFFSDDAGRKQAWDL